MKTKAAKLIFIPYLVTDYKVGTLIRFKNNREDTIYTVDNVFETQQPDHIKFFISFGPHTLPEKYLNGSVSLSGKPKTVQPYLISGEPVEAWDKFYNVDTGKFGEWQGAMDYESIKRASGLGHLKKLLATPEQIGMVKCDPSKDQYCTISRADYQTIHMRSGNCEIELEDNGAIKLIENKVIIHI